MMKYRKGEDVLVDFSGMDSREGVVVKALQATEPFSSHIYVIQGDFGLVLRYADGIRHPNEVDFTGQICEKIDERWLNKTKMLILRSRTGRPFSVPKNVISLGVAVFDPYTQDPVELIAESESLVWVWLWNADECCEEWVKVSR